MNRLTCILISLFCMISLPAKALEIDLSDKRIEIRYSFKGADLILFGAVGHSELDEAVGDFDIVVRCTWS